jgi:predicted transposase/invertase (TIGR01784 family)
MKEIYADLTQDLVFKKAFASEQDKELLISLLNAFLERKLRHPIADVTVKNPYIQGETLKNRDSIVDIRCKDAEGNNFIVEMQVSPQHFFIKRAIHYICMSVADSGKKGEDYNFDFPKTYSLNFLDFEVDFGRDCTEVVQYYSFSNEAHPENRLDYLNMVFVLLPRFSKSIDECETLHDKLLYSLCHAHEHNEQPEQLSGNLFDRLFTVIKISNFSAMEHDEYVARAMFRADQREQLRYAEDKGIEIGIEKGIGIGRDREREELFALWEKGVSLAEAKKLLRG